MVVEKDEKDPLLSGESDQDVKPAPEEPEGKESSEESDEEILFGKEDETGKDDTEPGKSKDPEGEPEQYDLKDLKIPEDYKVPEDVAELFVQTARELKLPKDAAQKMLEVGVKHAEAVMQSVEETNQAVFQELKKEWLESVKKDPEYGGQKFDETVKRASRVLKKYGSEALLEDLQTFGFTFNGELIKFLARMDKELGEHRLVEGDAGDKGRGKSLEELFYPTSK